MIEGLALFSSVFIGGALCLIGISTIAFGQVMTALREIAINTRKTEERKPRYIGIEITGGILAFLGILLIILGIVVVIVGIQTAPAIVI